MISSMGIYDYPSILLSTTLTAFLFGLCELCDYEGNMKVFNSFFSSIFLQVLLFKFLH